MYNIPLQVTPGDNLPLLPMQQHLDQVLAGGVGIHPRDPLGCRVHDDRQLHRLGLDQQSETLSRSQFFLRRSLSRVALVPSPCLGETATSGLLVEQSFIFRVWVWVVGDEWQIPAPPSPLPLTPIPFANHPDQTIFTLKQCWLNTYPWISK